MKITALENRATLSTHWLLLWPRLIEQHLRRHCYSELVLPVFGQVLYLRQFEQY